MIALTFVRVILHLCKGLLTGAFVFPFVGREGRDRRVRQWAIGLLSILRIKVVVRDVSGMGTTPHALIVANHVSWLDIFVINSLQPCRFVAKADIRGWPLLGWLAEKGGTIFIARGKQREVKRVYQGLVDSIRGGDRIAFFPEGTTAAQGTVLPFHSNLFEAAIEAGVPVQPYALRYVDSAGQLHAAADFIGDMTFVYSMLRIMRAGRMTAQLFVLPPVDTTGAHRRELALETHRRIAAVLDAASADE